MCNLLTNPSNFTQICVIVGPLFYEICESKQSGFFTVVIRTNTGAHQRKENIYVAIFHIGYQVLLTTAETK